MLLLTIPPDIGSHFLQTFGKRNPIYHFYEEVALNALGQHGTPGDKHYKCFHGSRKVLMVTKAMRSNLNGAHSDISKDTLLPTNLYVGLVGHLKMHFPAMYRLYDVLKSRSSPPTDEELIIASRKKILNAEATLEFLQKLERASATIIEAFNQQNMKDAVSLTLINIFE
jgi:hypothetical protein